MEFSIGYILTFHRLRVLLLLDLTNIYFSKAFSIDIIRHKDLMDELFSHRGEIFGTCGEEQKAVLQVNYSYYHHIILRHGK
jgi:hypothetical protein